MVSESGRGEAPAALVREKTPESDNDNYDNISGPPSPSSTDLEFNESQCLFCNQTNPDLDQNLAHMLKTHGLYIDAAHLLVDIETLLSYFNLVISGYYECLYCGTQRNTRQAVQQHMTAKGHCKYDISGDDAELRGFFEFPSSEATEERQRTLDSMQRRLDDDAQLPSQARLRKPRPPKRSDSASITASPLDQTPQSHADPESSSNPTETGSGTAAGEVSTRALKQEHTLNNQLAQLRASDRRSLLHLPASQQRALLSAHHKQMQKARRTEQAQRGHLETAGNRVNALDKVRLVRQPPHFGNVFNWSH
ncbi:uncharacterized protein A1O9_07559 [Exophiala aquamarina CBS 119918]|uniref:ZN622/Rei1/Reh1 zinc finger C2H2-type domain-containing protein n=1 Tax=Exophiala aquamarina CBS 119918 TaxID=1182545 RepID=A0A072P785_9EURO|nr:uncharacterized protein A1O9_07559 [Exophiala aquamarina CBS 119918]KEF55979.1 hypothetical protein A1O9_07559 [Exophiala aquamarina CBS 119918]